MFNRHEYAAGPDNFGELGLPDGYRDNPLAILIHGGFWRDQYRLDLMHPMAHALHTRGYATWNIEYRRVGASGGGYPTTLADVATAIDYIATLQPWHAVAVIGHSAGGHLALWNASRADPTRTPDLTVGLAAVSNVVTANEHGVGVDATANFFGGDATEFPDRYAHGQPDPTGFAGRVMLVHGDADDSVPVWQSDAIADSVDRYERLEGIDHFHVIDPKHECWYPIFDELNDLAKPA